MDFFIKEDVYKTKYERSKFEDPIKIYRIKPSVLSYLIQTRPEIYDIDNIIKTFEKILNNVSKDNTDFDKYINQWADKLLIESPAFFNKRKDIRFVDKNK